MSIQFLKRSLSSRAEFARRHASRPRSVKAGRRSGRSGGEVFSRLAGAVKTEPGTGAWRRLANEVLVPALVILIGALSVGLGIGVVKQFSGTGGAYPSQPSPRGRLRSASRCSRSRWRGAREESGRQKRLRRRRQTALRRRVATPAAAVSEPLFAPAPKTKKRSPAPPQPASEPVASSPAPSSGAARRLERSSSAGTERSSAGAAWHWGRRSLAWHCAGGRMTYSASALLSRKAIRLG